MRMFPLIIGLLVVVMIGWGWDTALAQTSQGYRGSRPSNPHQWNRSRSVLGRDYGPIADRPGSYPQSNGYRQGYRDGYYDGQSDNRHRRHDNYRKWDYRRR